MDRFLDMAKQFTTTPNPRQGEKDEKRKGTTQEGFRYYRRSRRLSPISPGGVGGGAEENSQKLLPQPFGSQ